MFVSSPASDTAPPPPPPPTAPVNVFPTPNDAGTGDCPHVKPLLEGLPSRFGLASRATLVCLSIVWLICVIRRPTGRRMRPGPRTARTSRAEQCRADQIRAEQTGAISSQKKYIQNSSAEYKQFLCWVASYTRASVDGEKNK